MEERDLVQVSTAIIDVSIDEELCSPDSLQTDLTGW